MNNNILADSHAICDVGTKANIQLPPPPPAPKISKASQKSIEKKEEKINEAQETREKTELFTKITEYFESESFAKFIPSHLKAPRPSDSMETLLALYESIKTARNRSAKRVIVNNLFDSILQGVEIGAVGILHWHHWQGLADDLSANKDDFQPELEELAIEMSNSWVPDAKSRLALKVLQRMKKYLNPQDFINPQPELAPNDFK